MAVKFLIIRFSSIGDIVLTSPVVRCIKNQIPDAEIYFLTKPQYVEIVSANPYINHVIALSENIFDTIQQIQKIDFQYVIDLHKNARSFLIKNSLSHVKHFSFNKLNIEKWLLVNFKINQLPAIHIVDRYYEAIKNLQVVNDGKGLDYFIPEGTYYTLPETHREYIVFSIGAQHETKKMPAAKWRELAKQIEKPIIILGGNECFENGEFIASSKKNILNLCGKTTLHETAFIIKQSQAIITHDTGLMHIAAAFQKPIVTIWGNTLPALGMYPYVTHSENYFSSEVSNLSCRPCSKLGKKKCPEGHFNCMQLQDINKIVRYIQQDLPTLPKLSQ